MQRYRPDIAWPNEGKPWPIMAEDSQEGDFYHRDDVERLRDALFRHACYCGCGDPNPALHRTDCVYRRACLEESGQQQSVKGGEEGK